MNITANNPNMATLSDSLAYGAMKYSRMLNGIEIMMAARISVRATE